MKPKYIEEADRGVFQKCHSFGEYKGIGGLTGRSEAFRVDNNVKTSWQYRKRFSHDIVRLKMYMLRLKRGDLCQEGYSHWRPKKQGRFSHSGLS